MRTYCPMGCTESDHEIQGLEACPYCGSGTETEPEPGIDECEICGNDFNHLCYSDIDLALPCGCFCCCTCELDQLMEEHGIPWNPAD